MSAYYNEIDPFAAAWLRELIKGGHIADGEVDERSIVDVQLGDLRGFSQCHFFAGIGGWSYALRLAGWPDDRFVWTGSCPCQPFSAAGKNLGGDDPRHLWPTWFRLIRECRPSVVFGEQVEAAIGHGWLDLVAADLEGEGYACGAVAIPAAGVGAWHKRGRLWFVADADRERSQVRSQHQTGRPDLWQRREGRQVASTHCAETSWREAVWQLGADGTRRAVKPGIRILAHGVPARVGRLRGYGNAIVPQVAAEVITAYMEVV